MPIAAASILIAITHVLACVFADIMALKIREISAEDVELVRMCWVLSGAKLCSILGFDLAERDIR